RSQQPLGRHMGHLNRSCGRYRYGRVPLRPSLEINYISFELLGDDEPVRDLARKPRLPNPIKELWGGLLAHNSHNIRSRHCSSIWEAFKKSSVSKPMVSMAMRNID